MAVIDEEIIKFIMVWSSFIVSTCYCHAVSKMVSQATLRFLMFLPVLCLFFLLPLTLKSINLVVLTVFSITWLATFKLLLLVFHSGPLSNPSLSLFHFVLISCLPLAIQHPTIPKPADDDTKNKENNPIGIYNIYEVVLRYCPYLATRGIILIILINWAFYKHKFPRHVSQFLMCVYLYLVMDVILVVVAIIAQILLGDQVKVEPPLNDPHMATSLQDFWGNRWNRVASSVLRSAIFIPVLHHSLPILGRKRAALAALLATFFVSELMHEIMFYYMCRVRLGWGTPLYFLVQGVCVAVETMLKRRINGRWEVPQVIMGPLIFGFEICTFMLLVFSELQEHKADDRVIQEYADACGFVKDLVLTWSKMSYDLLVQPRILKQV